jgi:putative ABC transport system permease protein
MRLHDLTLAIRHLLRRPAYTVTALLLLALGAGANAAVFSVVRGVLLRPLPYLEPERLVMAWPDTFVNNEDLTFWRERAHSFESIAAISPGWMMSLVVPGLDPVKVSGARTSDNFFTTLGVRAAHGQMLEPGDANTGASKVVVISAQLHERHFNRDPAIVGKHVALDGVDYEVVGVMPREFEFREPGTDLWTPLPFVPGSAQNRTQFSLAFARLRPGVTAAQAHAELQQLAPAMRDAMKKTADWGRDARVIGMQESVTGDVRSTLLILLGAVGLILLLAAVNLGTLVLSRSLERAREMAVRTALGATRGRLLWQFLTEQAVLASAGALVGLLLAWVALPVLVSRIPPDMPRQNEIALDLVVFAAVFAVTVLVSIAMAAVPTALSPASVLGLSLSKARALQPLLKQSQSTDTPARRRALGTLVTSQVALAVVLGIGAGLMLRSLWNLQHVDPGFSAANVLTFRLQTTSKPMNLTRGLAYFEDVLARVRAIPDVRDAGAIQHLPMSGYNWTGSVWRPENPPAAGADRPQAIWRFTGWEYFRTMGIALRAGRTFTNHDRIDASAVAIVNESLARREFGSAQAAVGKRLISFSMGQEQPVEVVGVVADVRFMALDKPSEPEIYRPLAQTFMFPMAFVVKTDGDSGSRREAAARQARIASAIRQAAFAVDPTIAVAEVQPLEALIAGTVGRPRLLAMLLSVFAAVGLSLGVIGVYGVVAYRVRQQEREFGIRLALGAGPARIARTVARQGAFYAVAGLAVGLPAAWLLVQLMESVLFGVTTHDVTTFTALPVTVTLAALLACAVPAWRAARVNPMTAMKE